MRVQRIATALLITTITAFIFGCRDEATPKAEEMAKQQDPAEEILAVLTGLQAAWKAQDTDKIMAAYSDDYSDSLDADKPGVRAAYEALAAQGALQYVTVSMEQCKIAVDDDSATAGPVIYETPRDTVSWSYRMKREADAVWRIDSSELATITPKLIERDPIRVIGLPIRKVEGGENDEWWARYMERDQELTPLSIDGAWYAVDILPGGLILPDGIPDGTHYIPGRAVSQDAVVPAGLVAYDVPGGLYAGSGVHGMYEKASDSIEAWIESAGYERDVHRPGIEYYAPESDPAIFVPVKGNKPPASVRISYDGEPAFSVEVPGHYMAAKEEGSPGDVLYMIGRLADGLPDLRVGVLEADEDATLEEAPEHYIAFLQSEYPSYTGHRVTSQKMIEMNDGTRAIKYTVLWLYSDGRTEFKTVAIAAFKSGKRITVRSTDHMSPVAVMERLVDSFQFHN